MSKAGKWSYTKILVYLLTVLGLIFCILPMSWMKGVYVQDRWGVERQLGKQTLNEIERKSSDWFQKSLVDTGVLRGSYGFLERQGKDPFDDRGLGALFANRLDVLWVAVRQMFFRFYVWLIWLPCAMILVPLAHDAYQHLQIRKNQSSSFSAAWYSLAKSCFAGLLAGLILGPIMPFQIPPMAVPVALGGLGAAMWGWLAYSPKRI
jgi:hypothetical protein